MTNAQGKMQKMLGRVATPIEYTLQLGAHNVFLNPYLGQNLQLEFTGKIHCLACNKALKKSYQQGYCFPCTQKLAACDMCVLKPETCHFAKGTCREPEWAQQHCFTPHIVYLANSSGLKVGITRETQIPNRWIDQGAVQALPIFRVKSRYQAGLLEVCAAKHMADKTDWRKMLRGGNEKIDLTAKRDELLHLLREDIQDVASKFRFGDIEILTQEQVIDLHYPVLQYPKKISSLGFDASKIINGILQGIKGQYLIFDSGVLNIRKFSAYEIMFSS